MEVFGPAWKEYASRIALHWKERVAPSDLVLIPGDISWAMRLDAALIDLQWIDALPGTKVLIRGNHDYWWGSLSKMVKVMPPSIHIVHNNVFVWGDVAIGGSRLWDTPEYNFSAFTVMQPNPQARPQEDSLPYDPAEDEKIFVRELERLKLSLAQLPKGATRKIAMTHYPPIGADLAPSRASAILEEYGVDTCVFGHLHSLREGSLPFGVARGVRYVFASCDYLGFSPVKLL
jgi:predicted phosphohydrolase